MQNERPHFKDFAEHDKEPLEGKKTKIADIFDKEILILGFRIKKSKLKDGNYATIQFEKNGTKYVVFTSSGPLMEQLERYSGKMPFYTKIIKQYNYYSMS